MTEHSIAFLGGLIIAAFIIVILSISIGSFISSFFFSSEQLPANMVYRLESLKNRLDSVDGEDSFLFNLNKFKLFSLAKNFKHTINRGEDISVFSPECVNKNCLCFAKFRSTVEKGAVACIETKYPVVSSKGELFDIVSDSKALNVQVSLKREGCTDLNKNKVDCLMFTNLVEKEVSLGWFINGKTLAFS